jgi:hypothetical protein
MGLRIADGDSRGFAIIDFQRNTGPEDLWISLRSTLLHFGEYLGEGGKWSSTPYFFKAMRLPDKGPGVYRIGPEIVNHGGLALDFIEISVNGTAIVEAVTWPILLADPDAAPLHPGTANPAAIADAQEPASQAPAAGEAGPAPEAEGSGPQQKPDGEQITDIELRQNEKAEKTDEDLETGPQALPSTSAALQEHKEAEKPLSEEPEMESDGPSRTRAPSRGPMPSVPQDQLFWRTRAGPADVPGLPSEMGAPPREREPSIDPAPSAPQNQPVSQKQAGLAAVLDLLPEQAPRKRHRLAWYGLAGAALSGIALLLWAWLYCVPFLGGKCKDSGSFNAAVSLEAGETGTAEAAAQEKAKREAREAAEREADAAREEARAQDAARKARLEAEERQRAEATTQAKAKREAAEREADAAREQASAQDAARKARLEAEKRQQGEAAAQEKAKREAREAAEREADEAREQARAQDAARKARLEAEERQRAEAAAQEKAKREAREAAEREADAAREQARAQDAARRARLEAEERQRAEAAAQEKAKREAREAAEREADAVREQARAQDAARKARLEAEERQRAETAAQERAKREAAEREKTARAAQAAAAQSLKQQGSTASVPDGNYSGRTAREESCSPVAKSIIVTIKDGKVCWEHELSFSNQWAGTIDPAGAVDARVPGRPGTSAAGVVVNGGTMSIEMTYPECAQPIRLRLLGMIGAASACP